eukprot:2519835-Pleurochrysis_carterae.AAC.7
MARPVVAERQPRPRSSGSRVGGMKGVSSVGGVGRVCGMSGGEGTTPRAGLQTPARLSGTRRALLRSALHSASRCSLRAASGCERLRRVPPPQSRKRRAHASAFRSPAASQRAHGALERASEPEAPSAHRRVGASVASNASRRCRVGTRACIDRVQTSMQRLLSNQQATSLPARGSLLVRTCARVRM